MQRLYRIAINEAFFQLGNASCVDEIANQAMYIYVLKEEHIAKEASVSWVRHTVQNICKQRIAEMQRQKKIKKRMKENHTACVVAADDELQKAFYRAKKQLSERNMKLLLQYYQCNGSIKELSVQRDESYAMLQKRIYRIKSKLRADVEKNMGMVQSKKLLSDHLNNIVIHFLKRFKYHLEHQSLDKMYYYFSKIKLNSYNPSLLYKTVKKYDVIYRNNQYEIHVLAVDKNDKPGSFFFSFVVDENKHLKITNPPAPHAHMIALKDIDNQKMVHLLKQYKPSSDGSIHFSEKDLNKIHEWLDHYGDINIFNSNESEE